MGKTWYKVIREVYVQAETHGHALETADALWLRSDHAEMANHHNTATVEPVDGCP